MRSMSFYCLSCLHDFVQRRRCIYWWMEKRHVIVVGGGIIGVTTAYELARQGFQTTLIEAREGVALETSYANGALLTPSMSDPWNAPGVHRHLLASLFDSESAMKLRLSAIPSLLGWGTLFFRSSNVERHAAATRASYILGKYSVDCLRELCAALPLEYDAATVGTLKVFRDARAMERPLTLAEQLAPIGLRFQVLDADAAVSAEPALAGIHADIAGALHFPDDGAGDPLKFSCALSNAFLRLGGVVKTSVQVSAIAIERGRVTGVDSSAGRITADKVVIAAGNATPALVRALRVSLPVKPVKGYTVTFDISHLSERPTMPVVDDALHAAVVPLGGRLRVAGTAEFAGENLELHRCRIGTLLKLLAALYPHLAAQLAKADGQLWTGLRPMSADGLPFIGLSQIPGLYVNTGHGHLGWTLATGSARLLTDLMTGVHPAIDPAPYRVTRWTQETHRS